MVTKLMDNYSHITFQKLYKLQSLIFSGDHGSLLIEYNHKLKCFVQLKKSVNYSVPGFLSDKFTLVGIHVIYPSI